ncbi:MAG: amidase, partial [Nocardioidaceae bacterium]|nr:amidase [Nocardioidaceae bacterium]
MTPARTRVHAFGDDALGDHDAVGLAEEIRSGRVSRQEAVEAAVDRTRTLDGVLNGLAADRFSSAAAEARETHPGFFAGVPTFVKDNSDVAGLPTQQGTRAYVAEPATADGDFARMFGLVGTTVLGKTRLSEYGFSPSAEYKDDVPVRNPWHTGHTSGASSAGSAAFVAAGAVPMSHANDGGGSIRIPAACNGLVGLKATRGRIPGDKLNREMPVQIVHDGIVTRSVRDTAA